MIMMEIRVAKIIIATLISGYSVKVVTVTPMINRLKIDQKG
jgi:hypothetical protein